MTRRLAASKRCANFIHPRRQTQSSQCAQVVNWGNDVVHHGRLRNRRKPVFSFMKGIMMSPPDFSDRRLLLQTAGVKGSSRPVRRAGFRYCFRATGKNASRNSRRTFRCRRGGFCSALALWFCWRSAPPRLLSTSSHDPTWPGSTMRWRYPTVNATCGCCSDARTAPRGAICLPVINPSWRTIAGPLTGSHQRLRS